MQYVVTDVLKHYEIDYRNAEGDKFKILCPFHNDHNPSGSIDLNTGQFSCWVCKKHVSLPRFISQKTQTSIQSVYYAIGRLDSTPSRFAVEDPANIEHWHVKLLELPTLLKPLNDRVITKELIQYYRLGAFIPGDGLPEIRIPIFNEKGETVSVKAYRPGQDVNKYGWPNTVSNRRNKKDRTNFLYPIEQLVYDKIVICGGEIKAIAAAADLNQYDIGAISGTGSENIDFNHIQIASFRNKIVYICYDIDEVGRRHANRLCRKIRGVVSELYFLELPLDLKQYPKGDINDYLKLGHNLIDLIEVASPWVYVPPESLGLNAVDENEVPIDTTLNKAILASSAKKKMSFKIVVSSKDTSPFSIPNKIRTYCDRNHTYCSVCAIYEEFTEEVNEVRLSSERVEIMSMIGQEDKKNKAVLKSAFGIPERCSSVRFSTMNHHNIEDVRISQCIDLSSRSSMRSMQAAYFVGETEVEMNEAYNVVGRMYPHPITQQATLLINQYEPTQDALATFKSDKLEMLEIFRPERWDEICIDKKLKEIYEDYAFNVTGIYGRQDLHLLYDLAYHSVLKIGDTKGWIEILVVGDSAQGKTEIANKLVNFYGLGERVVCKAATRAGLLGGIQQFGKRWFATWGKIPTQDRRLVILDEVKGTSVNTIGELTDMRSDGIARLTQIEKRETYARTRLIWLSNPRSSLTIREYNTGVDAIRELIGNPEDVRRFDAIAVVAQKEVPIEYIHGCQNQTVTHRYSSDLCRELVLFAWTVPNVEFEDKFYLDRKAVEMTKEFVENVPIVDGGTIREKLMRLSTALAVRTFSIKDSETVLVRRCHINYIIKYLKRLYSSNAFGYSEYSRKIIAASKLKDPEEIKRRIVNETPFPKELVYELLTADEFDVTSIQDVLGWQQQDARELLAFFNRHHAIRRVGKVYRKTAQFTDLLLELEKELDEEGGRPDHIPEEF
jgi:hypothetical protein